MRHSDGSTRAGGGGTSNALYAASCEDILFDDAGKVLPSGRSDYFITNGTIDLGRLQNTSSAGFACSMDIDGDGKVLGTTEGVLLARAMFGLKGTALTTNAIGAAAVRTDAAAITAFLVNRCQMKLNLERSGGLS